MSAADGFNWDGLSAALARGAFDFGVSRLASMGATDPASFIRNNQPLSLNAGSLNASFNPGTNTFEVTPGAARSSAIGGINTASQGLANDLGGLLDRIRPGFSDVRQSRLAAIENNRRRTLGNLRDNLSRRRISGSSFALDALSRAEAEFARQASDVEAQSILEELDATASLLTRKTEAEVAGLQALLNGMNFDVETGRSLITSASNLLNENNRLLADLAARDAVGRGALGESIASPIRGFLFGPAGSVATQAIGAATGQTGGLGGLLGSLFGGGGSAASGFLSAGPGIAAGAPAGGFAFPTSLSGVGSGVSSATGATAATPGFGGLGIGGALAAAAPAALFAMASMGSSAERGAANAVADDWSSQIDAARRAGRGQVVVSLAGQNFALAVGPIGDVRQGRWFKLADGRWVGIGADKSPTPIISDAPPDVSSQAAAPSYVQNGRLVTGPELTPWQRGLPGAVFGGGGGGDR